MNKWTKVLAASILTVTAGAQMQPGQMQNGPAGPLPPSAPDKPGDLEMRSDGHCLDARPGDIVHFTLTIESVANAHGIYADIRLRPKGVAAPRASALPSPDSRNLGGGGLGVRDTATGNVYHFAFRVPTEIIGGIYRGVGLSVTEGDAMPSRGEPADVDQTRHVREQVRSYCLNVFSGYGGAKPEVTDFTPGPVAKP